MTNFFQLFETVFYDVYETLDVEVMIPVEIDEGDLNTPENFAGGIIYDETTKEKKMLLNATSPWWQEGDLYQKMFETLRHEFRHLFQEQYLIDHYGFDVEICNFLMGANELYGGYEYNPYEVDAFRFEKSNQAFDEGLDWIDKIVAH